MVLAGLRELKAVVLVVTLNRAENYWLNPKTSYPCQGPDLASHFSISVLMYLSVKYALFEILGIARVDKQ